MHENKMQKVQRRKWSHHYVGVPYWWLISRVWRVHCSTREQAVLLW